MTQPQPGTPEPVLLVEFYEGDEPLEKIQQTRQRPPDFVTAPPAAPINWYDITPADARDLNLSVRLDITAPHNEYGERCPWPWDPQQLVGVPLGQYHCGWCGAMVLAGVPHIDYGAPGE